jgi:hypothetical protein
MRRNFSLPELEDKLDELQGGTLVQISRRDYERLFGLNDAARGRLRNFVRAHRCTASFAETAVLFRKHSAVVGSEIEAQERR